MESVHGHEVMRMMMESKEAFTPGSLEEAIHRRFGKEARFHTCSADNMTAEELILFLVGRNKFAGSSEAFHLRSGAVCNHE